MITLRQKYLNRILRQLEESNEGLTKRQLCDLLAISPSEVIYHLEHFVSLKIIKKNIKTKKYEKF